MLGTEPRALLMLGKSCFPTEVSPHPLRKPRPQQKHYVATNFYDVLIERLFINHSRKDDKLKHFKR